MQDARSNRQSADLSEGIVRLIVGRTAVRKIAGKGYGIVAAVLIGSGEVIKENLCLAFDRHDSREVAKTRLRHYVYLWEEVEGTELSAVAMGNLSFCNHSPRPNATIETDKQRGIVALRASRAIEPGSEITIDYDYELDFVVRE